MVCYSITKASFPVLNFRCLLSGAERHRSLSTGAVCRSELWHRKSRSAGNHKVNMRFKFYWESAYGRKPLTVALTLPVPLVFTLPWTAQQLKFLQARLMVCIIICHSRNKLKEDEQCSSVPQNGTTAWVEYSQLKLLALPDNIVSMPEYGLECLTIIVLINLFMKKFEVHALV